MGGFLGKILLLLTLGFSFTQNVFGFDAYVTSAELQNINTQVIESFKVDNYSSKSLLELSLLKKIDGKKIGDQILDWKINSICFEKDCYLTGSISTRSYKIYPNTSLEWNELNSEVNINREKLNIDNLTLTQKYNLFDYRVLKPLLIEFIIFFPLNLIIFHCLGYLLFLIFYKKLKINYFKRIYLNAGIFYVISFIILYYFGYGFTNFNAGLMGLITYFFTIGLFKSVLFLISRYTIERYNKIEKIKSNLGNNILLGYGIVFCLLIGLSYIGKILSNLF